MHFKELVDLILNDKEMIEILKSVRSLDLPDCWVAAGFVRNKVWDTLHGYQTRTKLADIDVVYFRQSQNNYIEEEREIEKRLSLINENINWEVVNQARTNKWHNRSPYKNTTEAISEWVETATSIGVCMNEDDSIQVTAPHGLDDLFNLIIRPVPTLKDISILKNRVKKKEWLNKWPKLKLEI